MISVIYSMLTLWTTWLTYQWIPCNLLLGCIPSFNLVNLVTICIPWFSKWEIIWIAEQCFTKHISCFQSHLIYWVALYRSMSSHALIWPRKIYNHKFYMHLPCPRGPLCLSRSAPKNEFLAMPELISYWKDCLSRKRKTKII